MTIEVKEVAWERAGFRAQCAGFAWYLVHLETRCFPIYGPFLLGAAFSSKHHQEDSRSFRGLGL